MGIRFSIPGASIHPWWVSLLLAQTAGCSLWPRGPLDGESRVPERGFSPWFVASLTTCLDDDCGPNVGQSVQSVDLRLADGRLEAVAARADGLYLGVLDPVGRLALSSPPILTPTQGWQASGLVDPAWLEADGQVQILYATADGTALGRARRAAEGWLDEALPWTTSATLGVDTISGPTALHYAGRVLVLFASGAGIEALAADAQPLGVVLDTSSVTTDRWQSIDRIQDPSLSLLADGSLGLFFAARGRLTTSDPSTPADFSIGFAATSDGVTFEPYADNPVHDQTSTLIFHADELAPAVAFDGRRGLMLCSAQRSAVTSLSLAVHEPR